MSGEENGASCASCVFPIWVQQTKDEHGPVANGYCRRHPPVPLLKTVAVAPAIVGGPPQISYEIIPAHSPTISRGWCGEYQTPEEYLGYELGEPAPDELEKT